MKRSVATALLAATVLLGASCGGSHSNRAAGPLAGTWQMNVTRAHLLHDPAYAAYGYAADAAGLAKEDAGSYRLVLNHGRLEDIEHLAGGDCHDLGTYRVHGSLFTFRISSGCDAGETWVYRWSTYRGELTFHKAGDKVPPNPTFAPWHMSGGG